MRSKNSLVWALSFFIISTIHAQATHKPTSQPIGAAQTRSASEASLSLFILITLSIIGCSVFCCCCRRRLLRRYYEGRQQGEEAAVQYNNQAYPPPSGMQTVDGVYYLNAQPMTSIVGETITEPPISVLNDGTPVVAIATYAPSDGGSYLSQQQVVYGVDGKQIK